MSDKKKPRTLIPRISLPRLPHRPHFFVSISAQISIFLIIICFVPIAGMLALKTYERQLIQQIENSNVQQARLTASALQGENLNREQAIRLLTNMNGRFDARIRILDKDAHLIADSAVIGDTKNKAKSEKSTRAESTARPEASSKSASGTFIYKLFSIPVRAARKVKRAYKKFFEPPVISDNAEENDYYSSKLIYDGAEVSAALKGNYGATTRISLGGQKSVNLYSAVPIFSDIQNGGQNGNQDADSIIGVVLVNRSTYKILQNLYELRVDLGKVLLHSMIAVILIAIFLAFRISLPLKKLSRQTAECADKKGRIISTEFTGKNRNDEIGELSRSFNSLIQKLNSRIKFTESFASDVSHEFKNPLAAIRTCTEVLESETSSSERQKLIAAVNEEISHLEALLNGARSITKIDGAEFTADKINTSVLASNTLTRIKPLFPAAEFIVQIKPDITIRAGEDYLVRVIENLVTNAASFGTKVLVSLNQNASGKFTLCVEDNGPGVPDSESQKIFARFYSNRPESDSAFHSGLGLSIVKAIVENLDGSISVSKSESLGGAKFEVII